MADQAPGGRRKETASFTIGMPGLPDLMRAMSRIPKELQKEIRVKAQEIADTEADRIRAAASTPLERLAAETVKSRRDRVPVNVGGGARRLATRDNRTGTSRPRAGDIFFGAEFGGGARPTTQQFQPHRGTEGYFFFPTLREDHGEIMETWLEAVDDATKGWTAGGDQA